MTIACLYSITMIINKKMNIQVGYAQKMLYKVFGIVATILLFQMLSASSAFAASNLSLSPASSSETVNTNFQVSLNINTNLDNATGVEVRVNFTGSTQYISGSAGSFSNCIPTFTPHTGYVEVVCIPPIQNPYMTGSGTVAVLTFKGSAAGSSTMTISNVTVGGSATGTLTGASYTFTAATSVNNGNVGETGNLPVTAISDTTFVVSVGLILIGIAVLGLTGIKLSFRRKTLADQIPRIFK